MAEVIIAIALLCQPVATRNANCQKKYAQCIQGKSSQEAANRLIDCIVKYSSE